MEEFTNLDNGLDAQMIKFLENPTRSSSLPSHYNEDLDLDGFFALKLGKIAVNSGNRCAYSGILYSQPGPAGNKTDRNSKHLDFSNLMPIETNVVVLNKPLDSPLSSAVSWLSRSTSEDIFRILTPQGHTFELASLKRNADFHELFPNVQERLIDDFTCAWLNEIILHGRLYITENSICFYTKVIWTYTLVVPMSEITVVEPKVVGGIFDNAMEISDTNKKYYFTSFLSRNQAIDLIDKLRRGLPNNVIEPKPVESVAGSPRKASGTSLSSVDGRRTRSMGSMEDVRMNLRQRSVSGLAEIVDFSDSRSQSLDPETASQSSIASLNLKKHIVHQRHRVTAPSQAQLESIPKIVLPSLPEKPVECSCLSWHETQKLAVDIVVGMDFEEAWEALYCFTSVDSGFMKRLWTGLQYTSIHTIT